MTMHYNQKLEEAITAKKNYRNLFVIVLVLLIILIGLIYKNTVLDYAVLENVKISRVNNTTRVLFEFDVVESGRIDLFYGETVSIIDKRQIGKNDKIHWDWNGKGNTEISLKCRNSFFPQWHIKNFDF